MPDALIATAPRPSTLAAASSRQIVADTARPRPADRPQLVNSHVGQLDQHARRPSVPLGVKAAKKQASGVKIDKSGLGRFYAI